MNDRDLADFMLRKGVSGRLIAGSAYSDRACGGRSALGIAE
jgi:hypothetical protein